MIIKVRDFNAGYKGKAIITLDFYDMAMNLIFEKDFDYVALPKEHTYKITDESKADFMLDVIQWPGEETEIGKKIFMFDYENHVI